MRGCAGFALTLAAASRWTVIVPRKPSVLASLLLVFGAAYSLLAGSQAPDGPVPVVFETTLGPITVALDQARAPITAGNFLRYVDQKRFDDSDIYRAVKIDEAGDYGLVQGGLQGHPKKVFKPILHEAPYATGLSHVDGAISMAREDPGSATADFFFVVGDLKSLDGKVEENDPGYAVFGRVTAGMEILKQILLLPRDPEKGADNGMKGQMLAPPVKILSVRRAVAAPGG
jgi:peptidyl-prolyl cis-trans isomerase A (cyclophilin A)